MQPRLVGKFAFIAWNAFTSNFISASKVENVLLFVSLQRCRATTETQELSGAALSILSLWQTERFEHGNWMVGERSPGRNKAEADEQGVAVWWDHISVLLPGVLPSIQTVPHVLAAAPAGPVSAERFPGGFGPSCVGSRLTPPPGTAWHLQTLSCLCPRHWPRSSQRGDPAWGGGHWVHLLDVTGFHLSLLNIHTVLKCTGSKQKQLYHSL